MTNREVLLKRLTRINSTELAKAIVRVINGDCLMCEERCPASGRCGSLKQFARMGEGINLSLSCEEIIQSWLEQEVENDGCF